MKNIKSELNSKIQFHRLKLTKKIQITKFVTEFGFHIPDHLAPNFEHKAGQYVQIKILVNGNEILKDFSILPQKFEKTLSVGIKLKSEREYHQKLKKLEIESELEISEPIGSFSLEMRPNENRVLLGFAAGIGITPILSQIERVLSEEKRSIFYLFYGNKNKESVAYLTDLEHLKQKYEGRFFVYYFFSKEKQKDVFFEGRLDAPKLKLIKNQILDWDEIDKVLICGPNTMIKDLANACLEEGIRKSDIHFEHFNTNDTEVFALNEDLIVIENALIECTFENTTKTSNQIHNKRKLLGQLLDKGLHLPYSCKSGVCGACACYLEEGKVHMTDENEYLTPNDLRKKLILPCISYIETDFIKLNFDI